MFGVKPFAFTNSTTYIFKLNKLHYVSKIGVSWSNKPQLFGTKWKQPLVNEQSGQERILVITDTQWTLKH